MLKLTSILLALTTIFTSCAPLSESGATTLLNETPNKKGNKKAVLFLKGGNATTDNSLQVTLCNANYKLGEDEVGNVFTVDSDHNSTVQDSISIKFTWVSNDTLQIEYDKKLRTFIQKKNIDEIAILYKPR